MPFKSQKQRALFYAKNKRGEISDAELKKWNDATPKGKILPEYVDTKKKKSRNTGNRYKRKGS